MASRLEREYLVVSLNSADNLGNQGPGASCLLRCARGRRLRKFSQLLENITLNPGRWELYLEHASEETRAEYVSGTRLPNENYAREASCSYSHDRPLPPSNLDGEPDSQFQEWIPHCDLHNQDAILGNRQPSFTGWTYLSGLESRRFLDPPVFKTGVTRWSTSQATILLAQK